MTSELIGAFACCLMQLERFEIQRGEHINKMRAEQVEVWTARWALLEKRAGRPVERDEIRAALAAIA